MSLRSNPPGGSIFQRDRSLAWGLAGLIFFGGLLLTLGVAKVISGFYQHQLEQRFAAVAGERASTMQARFDAHVADLDGVRRFFTNADQVTRGEFAGYVDGLPQRAFSYAWLPRVTATQRGAFERRVRASGIADFQLRELAAGNALQVAGARAEYFPVLFIESTQMRGDDVLGLDVASIPQRGEILQRAERSKAMAVSGELRFVAASARQTVGLMLAAPVFAVAGPAAGESLRGFLVAAFSLEQLLHEQERAEDPLHLSLELRDSSGLPGQALRYRSTYPPAQSALQLNRELRLADRRYALSIRPTEAFMRANSVPLPALLLAAGVLLSLLLALLTYNLASQRQRAQQLVREQTAVLRQRETELARVNGQLRGLLDAVTQVAIIATDCEGLIRTFNVGAERMLGYRAEELIGLHTPTLIHVPEEMEARARLLSERLGRPVSGFEVFVAETQGSGYVEQEWTYVRRDGSRLPVNLIVTTVRDEHGQRVGYLGIAIDITEARLSRQALEARDRLLEKLTANVPGAIYQYQLRADGSSLFPYASAGLRNVYEVEPEAVRLDASPIFERIHPEDLESVRRSILKSAERLQPWREDYRVLLPRQGLRWLRGEASPERLEDGGTLWHGYLSDITGPKLVEQELRALSITDSLTGIYNRRYFQERLEAEIARARRNPHSGLAVVMLDIDHFKQVNDRFGHDAGDQVLKSVCRRIHQRLRTIDVFCRLGGEEFIVLAPTSSEEQAASLARALWEILRNEPMEGVGLVTASFGVTAWRTGESAATMLSRVDAAVYQAKQAGRDRIQIAD
ncbi:diguanylate cyclase [Pseudomonas sp. R-28-1W-6]|uniref:diguanylate cyclase n=1 Tax=Pseudomonas sp. R-28-1W-6 TaxID=2650101 RepID=UPI0013655DA2|nr:diguanylate cyclase [Pseudomonas sp. R-28-1W-6]MWV12528.1 diguanylate cyclase [Pseudomonas sp. R-28-1W-6]